jgi:hypothetical protein
MRVEYSNYADMRDKHTQYVMNIMRDEHPWLHAFDAF